MKLIKDQRIKAISDTIITDSETLAKLEELHKALTQWPNKIVDIRFNKKFFTEKNDFREYTKYDIVDHPHSYSDFKFRIYVNADCYINLASRDTSHVLAQVSESIDQHKKHISSMNESIDKLKTIDEQAIINDLKAIYHKHNKPIIWKTILDSYDVSYPN